MTLNRYCITSLLLTFALLSARTSFALNETTHEQINKTIAKGAFLDSYLRDALGIENGSEAVYKGEEVWKHIGDGGIYEDSRPVPLIYPRSFYHFHDPTKPLDEAGYSGDIYGIPINNDDWKSSIVWALDPDLQRTSTLGGYSWPCVREYFYKALTATTPKDRDTNFAETFRGVGQLMHLVEDASVPLHTRNNGHPFGFHYEEWVCNLYPAALRDYSFAYKMEARYA